MISTHRHTKKDDEEEETHRHTKMKNTSGKKS